MADREVLAGRLVLADRVAAGRISVVDGMIADVALDEGGPGADGPLFAPGFVDVHVHGWGGHSAMGPASDLDGMAGALLRNGVTSFLPTAWTSPLEELTDFAERYRRWAPLAPADGAEPLGFNLEGPFIAAPKRGAHDPEWLREPSSAGAALDRLLDGLRIITVAPELAGALELIGNVAARGAAASLGHSAATLDQARAGYAAGARTTTHLFNAMSGIDHHAPGLAVAALTDDEAWVELIADGHHVDRALWPIIVRTKPADRLILVSDALPVAGTEATRLRMGGLDVVVEGSRCWIAGTTTLAGSVIAVDTGVRNLVATGVSVPAAVAAASANPLAMLGVTDRGRIEAGLRADLVELDDDLRVRRVWTAGRKVSL
jgi:N-acetylglucosamine-6-phosphate deacetylase